MLVVPCRVFGQAARREALPFRRRPLGIGCSFRVLRSVNYRGVGFREPALPLAVSSAVRVSFAGPRRSGLAGQCTLSSSFAFLQSLAQLDLADRPQPASSSHGLCFPTAHQGSEVHLPRGLPQHPLRSARRVCLPSRRFTPSEPVPAFFHAGSAHGIYPSELSPLGRYPSRFRADEPTRRFSRRYSRRRSAWAGPTGRGLWAFTLPGVPCGIRRVSAATAGCSLGLCPLRVCRLGLCTGLRPCSSLALSETGLTTGTRGASESQSTPA
jgi:hypothetical protein